MLKRKALPALTEICLGCDRQYLAAWAWIFTERGAVIPLDAKCSRRLRYCPVDERRGFIAELVARIGSAERRAAA
jgi:hypothetical protein